MAEYYKLSSLVKNETLASWEEVYLEINGSKSRIIATNPQVSVNILSRKLEKMSEEEMEKLFLNLSGDDCH